MNLTYVSGARSDASDPVYASPLQDSIWSWICPLTMNKRRQNVVRTSVTPLNSISCVPCPRYSTGLALLCSNQVLMSSVHHSRGIKSNLRFSNSIERKSNENRTIKFDVVWSSNEIELTENKCESNQIERSIKFEPNDT